MMSSATYGVWPLSMLNAHIPYEHWTSPLTRFSLLIPSHIPDLQHRITAIIIAYSDKESPSFCKRCRPTIAIPSLELLRRLEVSIQQSDVLRTGYDDSLWNRRVRRSRGDDQRWFRFLDVREIFCIDCMLTRIKAGACDASSTSFTCSRSKKVNCRH